MVLEQGCGMGRRGAGWASFARGAAAMLLAVGAFSGTAYGVQATGGDVADAITGGVRYRTHTFTNNGTFAITAGGEIEYFVAGVAVEPVERGGGPVGCLTGKVRVAKGSIRVVVGSGGINAIKTGLSAASTSGYSVIEKGADRLGGARDELDYPYAGATIGGLATVAIRYEVKPEIQNKPATGVTSDAATLSGLLVSTGGLPAAVCVLWGEANGAARGAAWSYTNWWTPGTWTDGSQPVFHVTNLTPDRVYHYAFGLSNTAGVVVATDPVSFMTGAVEVRALRAESTEERPAAFVISRPTTATNGALAVRYALGGTGVNGFDYDRLNTSVVIPQGASEVSLRVAPIFRFADKQSKLVSLIIVPEGYMTGASSTASMNTCPSSAL